MISVTDISLSFLTRNTIKSTPSKLSKADQMRCPQSPNAWGKSDGIGAELNRYFGIKTWSITWITPLLCITS